MPSAGGASSQGVCRLTLSINQTNYRLRLSDGPFDGGVLRQFRLSKTDGTHYTCSILQNDVPVCDCGDYEFRRVHRDALGCKHIRALRALGLLFDEWQPAHCFD